jgi:RNase P protein component
LKPGTDYVIIATSQVADVRFERLTSWLADAIERTSHA